MSTPSEPKPIFERRVIVTRPRADAEALAGVLQERGIESLIEPMMTVSDRGPARLDLTGAQAVLVTSANGVRALVGRTDERRVPVYAVGDASARSAREAGFETVESAGGDVDDLAALVASQLDLRAGPLIHVAGTEVAGDLANFLASDGFDVRRQVLYAAEATTGLSDETRTALTRGNTPGGVSGVLLFSPRTAAIFEELVVAAGLANAAAGLLAFCLSANVAAATSLAWRRVLIAEQPTQQRLLDTLAACYD